MTDVGGLPSAIMTNMPTVMRRENDIIKRFLRGYDGKFWSGAKIDLLDTRMDKAVEVLATRPSDGLRLAIEHTIIEPFVGEKGDFAEFLKAGFLSLEQDQSLHVPGTWIRVDVQVGAIHGHPTTAAQRAIISGVRDWIVKNRTTLPRGHSDHTCTVTLPAGQTLQFRLHARRVPLREPMLSIRRLQVEQNLGRVIEKALANKLPKLINTPADRRILMLERQHMNLYPASILAEIQKRAAMFPDVAKVDEIWFVETMGYDTESILYFERDGNGKDSFIIGADGSVIP